VPLTERSMIAPRDAYAESKARAEEALRAIAGLRLAVLRPPLVYGPGVKGNFLSLMRAIDRGLPLPFSAIVNRRSLVYVGNLADAILRCAEAPQAVGRCYLVCDGAPVSTPELCRKLAAALGRPARLFRLSPALLELLPGARRLTRSLEVDDSALRRELGWHAPFTLEQGLGATADWNRRP
jgi:nucleoside-diphosphate-sugar epimerase